MEKNEIIKKEKWNGKPRDLRESILSLLEFKELALRLLHFLHTLIILTSKKPKIELFSSKLTEINLPINLIFIYFSKTFKIYKHSKNI